MKKPRVSVVYRTRGHWSVTVGGHDGLDRYNVVVVAHYKTRDGANGYAKRLRKALRGE